MTTTSEELSLKNCKYVVTKEIAKANNDIVIGSI